MDFLHPWIAVAVTFWVFAVLQLRRETPTDLLFLVALIVVTATGVISPDQALAGFANQAVLTIAGLLAVSSGLRSAGVLDWIGRKLLGDVRTERGAWTRLAPALLVSSAFLLNTALVAMALPVVLDWCRRRGISPSRLLLPVSYLAILGGVCTLIGTSTTLVANGILRDEHAQRVEQLEAAQEVGAADRLFVDQLRPMQLLELGKVGAPCAIAGGLFLFLFGPRLLPRRADIVNQLGEKRREYLVEMLVLPNCPLAGQTVEQAGMRNLPGLFLIEIDRSGEVLTPVSPEDKIQAADRLVFTGIVSTIVDLEKIPGLVPTSDDAQSSPNELQPRRHLTEVVLSRTSPLIGSTVRDAGFRQRYNAAVVAVHRDGARVTNKIGNIRLQPGDTLLLQTRYGFVPTYRNSRDFYLVSNVDEAEPRRHHKFRTAAFWGGALVLWLIASSYFQLDRVVPGLASPAIAAILVATVMILTRCVRASEARNAIDLQMLLTIAAALGLGKALQESGAADGIANRLVDVFGSDPRMLLLVVYLLALVFTETITNNAVAAMLLPLAISVAQTGGHNPRPFIMAVTLAASLSFITPIGYQTNLMVMGPGGYRPSDYLKLGIPLAVIVGIAAQVLIPRIWPF